ncbi:MAG TPA: HD domain-containing protein, partial [Thermomicrobiales bacterium]|nr:HD domain-containing protein [Thermomicrobiales bacterium]
MRDLPPDHDDARGLTRFLRQLERLKSLRRTGWRDRGVPRDEIESVADHTLRVAVLAWLTAEAAAKRGASIDPNRVLQLALVHDLAEALAGDLPPYDPDALPSIDDAAARRAFLDRRHRRAPARDAAKRAAEERALDEMTDELPDDLRRL